MSEACCLEIYFALKWWAKARPRITRNVAHHFAENRNSWKLEKAKVMRERTWTLRKRSEQTSVSVQMRRKVYAWFARARANSRRKLTRVIYQIPRYFANVDACSRKKLADKSRKCTRTWPMFKYFTSIASIRRFVARVCSTYKKKKRRRKKWSIILPFR